MLLKLKEDFFVNIENIIIVVNVYRPLNTNPIKEDSIVFVFDSDKTNQQKISVEKKAVDLKIIEHFCFNKEYLKIGYDLVNTKKINAIKITEEAELRVYTSSGNIYQWSMPEINEMDIKNVFENFQSESVVVLND